MTDKLLYFIISCAGLFFAIQSGNHLLLGLSIAVVVIWTLLYIFEKNEDDNNKQSHRGEDDE